MYRTLGWSFLALVVAVLAAGCSRCGGADAPAGSGPAPAAVEPAGGGSATSSGAGAASPAPRPRSATSDLGAPIGAGNDMRIEAFDYVGTSRKGVPEFEEMRPAFENLKAALERQGVKTDAEPIVVFPGDNPEPKADPADLDVILAIPIPAKTPVAAPLVAVSVPEGAVRATPPLTDDSGPFRALGAELKAAGRIRGPIYMRVIGALRPGAGAAQQLVIGVKE